MNNWKIPKWLEEEIRARDTICVYCGADFGAALVEGRKTAGTWEHIVNDARIVTRDNIARCCAPCNSSKGTKTLAVWLESAYCKKRGISKETVADVVKRALASPPSLDPSN
jgi:hypothetical protein